MKPSEKCYHMIALFLLFYRQPFMTTAFFLRQNLLSKRWVSVQPISILQLKIFLHQFKKLRNTANLKQILFPMHFFRTTFSSPINKIFQVNSLQRVANEFAQQYYTAHSCRPAPPAPHTLSAGNTELPHLKPRVEWKQ